MKRLSMMHSRDFTGSADSPMRSLTMASASKLASNDPTWFVSFFRIWPVILLTLAGGVCSAVIGPDGPIHIAVKPVHQHADYHNDGSTSRAVALSVGGLYTGPYFDPFTPTDISVQVGSNALLPCRVRQAGNRSVSWVRKGDGHLLAVGDDTFISDGRFQAQKIAASDTWTLQIRSVQPSDAGDYECQVSSNEPKISRVIHLRAVEPVVSIKGAPDMYVKSGSPVTLHCQISSFLLSPTYVEWRLNGTLLAQVKNQPFNQRGNGEGNWIVGAKTDEAGRTTVLERIQNDSLMLTLALPSVSPEDSGQYLCSPTNMASVNASLHVVIGEHPAAMQHGDNSCGHSYSHRIVVLLSTLVSFLWHVWPTIDRWQCFHVLNRPIE